MKKNNLQKIHIVGGTGQMGKWLREFLESNDFFVSVSNSQNTESNTDLSSADIIFFSVPITKAPDIISHSANQTKPDALLVDLSSIASPSFDILKATGHPSLALHFLFGPSISELQNQKIVFMFEKNHADITMLHTLFTRHGAEVITMPAEDHDFSMAHIQALTHYINLLYMQTLLDNNIHFPPQTTTPVFLSQYAVAMRILTNSSPELLAEIQTVNPYFKKVLSTLIKNQSELAELISRNSQHELTQRYAALKTEIIPEVKKEERKTDYTSGLPKMLRKPGVRSGYLGPEGTYTHQALNRLLSEMNPQQFGFKSIYDVFTAVATEQVEIGIVGAENSTEGAVRETLDYLLDFDLRVIAAIDLPIHHSLLSKSQDLASVTKVIAHPQALAQSRNWLRSHLPHAKTESAASNLAGLERIDDEGIAIIASQSQAEKNHLHILSENIEDNPNNVTRFYVIAKQNAFEQAGKTILFVTVFNRVGVLRDILNVFADFNISLDKIESRPSKEKNWDYHFFIQVDIGPQEQRLEQSLNMLRQYCQTIKIIGSF